MRVLHIIPSAFDYFDDIRVEGLGLLDKLIERGVDAEAITLQYGEIKKHHDKKEIVKKLKETKTAEIKRTEFTPVEEIKFEKKAEVVEQQLKHRYIGQTSVANAFSSLSDFDIIHLHCPFFGSAGKILNWKKANPEKILAVTYYHPIPFVDIFSIVFQIYNQIYLPKIFRIADVVLCLREVDFKRKNGYRYLSNKNKLVELGGASVVHLTDNECVVKLIEVYENLLN